ncbi:MAG: cadherin domain-containing protein [Marinifilaceae bacterium]|jgi:surface protein|nr:cadherin domain-containing protein [Marinifilaceae bacterium]
MIFRNHILKLIFFYLLFNSYQLVGQTYTSTDFVTVWRTTTPNEIVKISINTLPYNPSNLINEGVSQSYNYNVDWNSDGNFEITGAFREVTYTFANPGDHTIVISGDFYGTCFNIQDAEYAKKWIDVIQWGNIQWESMYYAFQNTSLENISATDNPNIQNVISMHGAFKNAINFNSDINSWNTANVVTFSELFHNCEKFNKALSSWTVNNAQYMNMMFCGANSFNQDLSSWTVSSVTNLNAMFKNASSFNQNIGTWDISACTDLSEIFMNASSFNHDISNWNTSNVQNAKAVFNGARNFNSSLSGNFLTNLTNASDLSFFFANATKFNQSINQLNTNSVTNLESMFEGASAFNQELNNNFGNNIRSVTIFKRMFKDAFSFDQNIGSWDISACTDITEMFMNATSFNQDISNWNTSNIQNAKGFLNGAKNFDTDLSGNFFTNLTNVSDFSFFFANASSFNQSINQLDLSSATNLESMFEGASSFNQQFDQNFGYNLSSVTSFKAMFKNASSFNQTILDFNIDAATSLESMFEGATNFNQEFPLASIFIPHMQNVETVKSMFKNATSFNQDLSNFNYANISNMEFFLLNAHEFSTANYDALITLLENPGYSLQQNVKIHISSKYSSSTSTQRSNIISTNSWEIFDLGESSSNDFILSFTTTKQNQTIEIPLARNLTNNVDFSIDWGDGNSELNQSQSIEHTYAEPGIYFVKISGDIPSVNFSLLEKEKRDALSSIQSWGNINWEIMQNSFANCSNLEIKAKDAPITSTVTNFSSLFKDSPKVNLEFTNWDFSNATKMNNMLYGANSFSTENYDILLNKLDAEVSATNITIDVDSRYSPTGEASRTNLINNKSWTINDIGSSSNKAFVLEIVTNSPNFEFTFPAVSNGSSTNYNIDWGDGNIASNQNSNSSNTYTNAGKYTITITGDIYGIDFSSVEQAKKEIKILVKNWGTNNWKNLNFGFMGCTNLIIDSKDSPDLSECQSLSSLFENATNFNSNISKWNVSGIKDFSRMFANTNIFDQNINNWTMSAATDLSYMFLNSKNFNGLISDWDVSNVENIEGIFQGSERFNKDINSWNLIKATSLANFFKDAKAYNKPLDSWDVSNITNFESMFENAEMFNSDISNWNISQAQNMTNFCKGAESFSAGNYSRLITAWSALSIQSGVTIEFSSRYFPSVSTERSTIESNGWSITDLGTSLPFIIKVECTSRDFKNHIPIHLNYDYDCTIDWGDGTTENYIANNNQNKTIIHQYPNIGFYEISITGKFPGFTAQNFPNASENAKFHDVIQWGDIEWESMAGFFYHTRCKVLTAKDTPNTSNVKDFSNAFYSAILIELDLSKLDVSKGEDFSEMFYGAGAFNSDLSNWNVSNAKNMESMFRSARHFDSDLNSWDVSNVENMNQMFYNAQIFNHDIGNWNVSKVKKFRSMFVYALKFNQDLSNWRPYSADPDAMFDMLSASDISMKNYDKILNTWVEIDDLPPTEILTETQYHTIHAHDAFNRLNAKGWTVRDKCRDIGDQPYSQLPNATSFYGDGLGPNKVYTIISAYFKTANKGLVPLDSLRVISITNCGDTWMDINDNNIIDGEERNFVAGDHFYMEDALASKIKHVSTKDCGNVIFEWKNIDYIGESDPSITHTILPKTPPVITINSDPSVDETDSNKTMTITFEIDYTILIDINFEIEFSSTASAEEGIDFNFTTKSFTIPAGSSSISTDIEIFGDDLDEGAEQILFKPINIDYGTHDGSYHQIEITNDDYMPVYSTTSFNIDENTAIGTVAHTVSYTDVDDKGLINLRLDGTNTYFEIKNDFDIVVKADIDFESIQSINLPIILSDGSNENNKTFIINVNNLNDNKPIITNANIADVDEDDIIDTRIITLTASDADDPSRIYFYNWKITSGNDDSRFRIKNSDRITLLNKLDRETKDQYILTVTVDDQGSGDINTSDPFTITINVNDANDEKPTLVPVSDLHISEDAAIYTSIAEMSATDPDLPENTFFYNWKVTTDVGSNIFYVNPGDHKLYLGKSLDRETTAVYNVQLTVNDDSGLDANTSDPINFKIFVDDINDSPPVINSPANINVNELTSINDVLITFTATDDDLPENTNYTNWRITSGNEKGKFELNSITGELKLIDNLDFQVDNSYTLKIKVDDDILANNPNESDEFNLTINIIDENDKIPEITTLTNNINVSEGLNINTVVKIFDASDEDSHQITNFFWTISSGNDDGKFAINSNTGELYIYNLLDREDVDRYYIGITVYDAPTGGNQSSEKIFPVIIEDVNDKYPIIQSPNSISISENTSINTIIASMVATDEDLPVNTDFQNWRIISGNDDGVFSIDANTGEISLVKTLNFHSIQKYSLVLKVDDAATNPRVSPDFTLTINIQDQNDRKPIITPVYGFAISENTAINTNILTLYATDEDDANITNFQWRITNGNNEGKFQININTGVLELIGNLDRETTNEYNLELVVSDDISGGNDSDPYILTISIIDINDNIPEIVSASSTNVAENASIGTSVITLLATDKDFNTKFYNWTIKSGNTNDAFEINPTSGLISTKKILDNFPEISYTLIITVDDDISSNSPNTSNDFSFTINLSNSNNKAPVIDPVSDITIAENKALNSIIESFTAQDEDGGSITDFFWLITTGNGNEIFELESSTGNLILKKPLDYETEQSYIIGISVKDAPAGGNTSQELSFKINVSDINDEKPVILGPSSISVSELTPTNSVISTMFAVDDDTSVNTALQNWTIKSGNADNKFAIDASSGELSIANNLDYEQKIIYDLMITVDDNSPANAPNTSNDFAVKVTVLNANDNKPIVTPTADIHIVENHPLNQVIQTFAATDSDGVYNSDFKWFIDSGNEEGIFEIDIDSGELSVIKNIDRESNSSYTLSIIVKDFLTGGYTSDTYNFTINIDDVNDSKPVITDPVSVDISESVALATSITTMIANDDDSAANTNLTNWLIVSGNSNNDFSINSNTGEITNLNNLDFETKNIYELFITVDDNTSSANTSDQFKLTINIDDANDETPVIDPISDFSFNENVIIGETLNTFTATDNDSNEQTEFKWSISSGNADDKFEIEAATGKLILKNKVDRETKATYTLGLIVEDAVSGGNSSSEVQFTINILDSNDSKPIIDSPNNMDLNEDTSTGTVLITFSATDNDLNSNFTNWTIKAGNDENLFSLDAATGELSLINPLKYISPTIYKLIITVEDDIAANSPNTSENFEFELNLINVNNQKPIINPIADIELVESTSVNTIIGQATASDEDGSTLTKFNWSISSGNTDNDFSIDVNTGEMSLVKTLDRVTKPNYTLGISVTDAATGGNTSAEVQFTITITDINDNKPIITGPAIISVLQSNPIGSAIGSMIATDLDENTYFQNWTIKSGNTDSDFSINPNTGVLILEKALDYATKPTYTLVISVQDDIPSKSPNTSDDFMLTINVAITNNNPPSIDPIADFDLNESTTTNTIIKTFTATDSDPGTDFFWSIITGNEDNIFELELNTGNLVLKSAVDRETKDSYNLNIIVKDMNIGGNVSEIENFTINITDFNDNKPIINDPGLISFAEDKTANSLLTALSAQDDDSSGNTNFNNWQITNGNTGNVFSLDPNTGELKLASVVDYEVTANYSLSITVDDNTTDANTSDAININIEITDINDNTPSIDAITDIEVLESEPVGTSIKTLTAQDADSPGITIFNWSITSGNSEDKFELNNSTGELSIKNALDRESTTEYNLRITVEDKLTGGLTSSEVVQRIIIKDVNDSKPVIIYPDILTVAENISINTKIASFTVTDDDELPENKDFQNFKIKYGNSQNIFNIVGKDLSVIGALDFTKQNKYELVVTVDDAAVNPNTSDDFIVTINITNTNNSAPTIDPISDINIDENHIVGNTITTFTATDPDGIGASDFNWTIVSGNDDGKFELEALTGILNLIAPVDREDKDSYSLRIVVSDKQIGGNLSPEVSFNININDINDNKPTIDSPNSVTIAEDIAINTIIASMLASDLDSPAKTSLQNWTITSGNDDNLFEINSSSGEISTIANIDYESNNTYDLKLRVDDNNSIDPTLSSDEFNITINITDVNDNIPVIDNITDFNLSEDFIINNNIKTFTAQDPDSNTEFNWSITSGNTNEIFVIETLTGIFKLNKELDRETMDSYTIGIKVADMASGGNLSTETIFNINIDDINDSKPEITAQSAVDINEDLPINTIVATMTVTDADLPANTNIQNWQIVSGNTDNDFSINPSSGEIELINSLDFERTSTYTLNINVQDNSSSESPNTSDNYSITITINDLNDVTPIISPNQTFLVQESISEIGVLEYSNPDGNIISYEITGIDASIIEFDIASSKILLKSGIELDYELEKHIYEFDINISDELFKSNTEKVLFYLADINDNKPTIQNPSPIKIADDLSIGSVINTFIATDLDEINNNKINNWRIVSGNDGGEFILNSTTGELSTNSILNHATTNRYEFEIVVSDDSSPSIVLDSDNESIVIEVLDSKLVKPIVVFGQSFSIEENSDTKQFNIEIEEGIAGIDSYVLEGDFSENFTYDISNSSLNIKESYTLDYETTPSYNLFLTIANNITSSERTEIIINIIDINDTQPEIVFDNEEDIRLNKDMTSGTVLNSFEVNDPDSDSENLTWEILNDDLKEVFGIEDGNLTIKNPDLIDDREIYKIQIRVSDGDQTSETIEVIVINENSGSGTGTGDHEEQFSVSSDSNFEKINIIIYEKIIDVVNVKIFNAIGQLIFVNEYSENNITINKSFENGSYVIIIRNGNSIASTNYVIAR